MGRACSDLRSVRVQYNGVSEGPGGEGQDGVGKGEAVQVEGVAREQCQDDGGDIE
jgi:hypothetical protein